MKKSICFVLVLLLMFSMFTISFANGKGNKFLKMNEVIEKKNTMKIPLSTDSAIYSKGGKVIIPIRGFANSIGVEVGWNEHYDYLGYEDERAIIMTKGAISVIILIDVDDGIIFRNGEEVELGIKPNIMKNRSYVPNRFFKILFDAEFDEETGKELIGDPNGQLTEANLNSKYIELTLINESFVDGTLSAINFDLINGPEGLTIQSIFYDSSTEATVYLDFEGPDFDEDYDEFMVAVSDEELVGTGGALTTQFMPIKAIVEQELIGIPEEELTESNLDGVTISCILVDETFTDDIISDGAISDSAVTLLNAPERLTIGSIDYVSPTAFDIVLAFDVTDFDEDIDDFRIRVSGAALSSGVSLETDDITIAAIVEEVQITSGAILEEDTLSGSSILVTLINDTFADTTLASINFILNNAPTGSAIGDVEYDTTTQCAINLVFDGTDFDVDITDFSVTVLGEELSSGGTITSGALTIEAN